MGKNNNSQSNSNQKEQNNRKVRVIERNTKE